MISLTAQEIEGKLEDLALRHTSSLFANPRISARINSYECLQIANLATYTNLLPPIRGRKNSSLGIPAGMKQSLL